MVQRANRGFVYAVADGIGTADVGRQAAWQLVDSLSFFFSAPEESFAPGPTMKAIISATHTTLQRLANHDSAGACMALIYVAPNHQQGYILSVGNSPVYMRRANEFQRIAIFFDNLSVHRTRLVKEKLEQ